MAAPNDFSSRALTLGFLLPPVALGCLGLLSFITPSGEDDLFIAALMGLAGMSVGHLLSNGLFPDGWRGFGRIAGLWLGFALMLPAVLVGGAAIGGGYSGLAAMAAAWVMASSILFGNWHLLTGRQIICFAKTFYGWSALALVLLSMLPHGVAAVAALGMLFASAWGASVLNQHLRAISPLVPGLSMEVVDFPAALKGGFYLLDTAQYPQAITANGAYFFMFKPEADGYQVDEASIRRRGSGDLETDIETKQLGRHLLSMHGTQDFTAEPSFIPGPYRVKLMDASGISAFLAEIARQRFSANYMAEVEKVIARSDD